MPQPASGGKCTLRQLTASLFGFLIGIILGCYLGGMFGWLVIGSVFLASSYLVNEAKAGNPWHALLIINLIGTIIALAIHQRRNTPTISTPKHDFSIVDMPLGLGISVGVSIGLVIGAAISLEVFPL